MKEKLKILVMIIFGIIIGIFSKYSDTSGKTFSHYFGILSSGIFLWFFTAALILYLAKNRKSFNLYYLSFMGSMLVSYYLYSKYVIHLFTKSTVLEGVCSSYQNKNLSLVASSMQVYW